MVQEEEVVSMIKSCIALKTNGMPIYDLESDYRDLVGDRIPFRDLGYSSLKDFLSTVPEIHMSGNNERNIILSIRNDKTAHITAMIECQKSDTRRSKRRTSFRPPPRASRRGFRATDRGGRFSSNSYVVPPRFRRSQIESRPRSNVENRSARTNIENRPARSNVENRPARSNVENRPARSNLENRPARSNLENRLLRVYSESWEEEKNYESRSANKDSKESVRCDTPLSESGSLVNNRRTSSPSFSYKNRRGENSQVSDIPKPRHSTNIVYSEEKNRNSNTVASSSIIGNVKSEQPLKEEKKNVSNGAIKKTRTAASHFYEKKPTEGIERTGVNGYGYSVDQKHLLNYSENDLVESFEALDFENTVNKNFQKPTLNSRFTTYQGISERNSVHSEKGHDFITNRKSISYSDWDDHFEKETASYRPRLSNTSSLEERYNSLTSQKGNFYNAKESSNYQATLGGKINLDRHEEYMKNGHGNSYFDDERIGRYTQSKFTELEHRQKPSDSFPSVSTLQSHNLARHSALNIPVSSRDVTEEHDRNSYSTSRMSESKELTNRLSTSRSLVTTNANSSSSFQEPYSNKTSSSRPFIEANINEPIGHSSEGSWFKKPVKMSVSGRLERWREPSIQNARAVSVDDRETPKSAPFSRLSISIENEGLTKSKQDYDSGQSKESVKDRKLSLSSPVYEEYEPEWPRSSVNSRLIACRQLNQNQLEFVEQKISARKISDSSELTGNSSYHSDSDASWDELEVVEVEPTIFGYQMIGDDIFIDLAEQNLGALIHLGRNIRKRCGLCISGQTLDECVKRISTSNLSDRVIILLGMIDIIRGAKLDHLKKRMADLISVFMKHVGKLVLLTLPPLIGDCNWKTLLAFNKWIKNLKNMSSRVIVIDIWPVFFPSDCVDYKLELVNYKLYERRTRPVVVGTKIHRVVFWNEDGRSSIISLLREHLIANRQE